LSSVLYCIVLCWTVQFITVPSHITVHYITSHTLADGFILNNIPVFLSYPILPLPLFILNQLFSSPLPPPTSPPPFHPDPTARLVFLWHCHTRQETIHTNYQFASLQSHKYNILLQCCIVLCSTTMHSTVLPCTSMYCTLMYITVIFIL